MIVLQTGHPGPSKVTGLATSGPIGRWVRNGWRRTSIVLAVALLQVTVGLPLAGTPAMAAPGSAMQGAPNQAQMPASATAPQPDAGVPSPDQAAHGPAHQQTPAPPPLPALDDVIAPVKEVTNSIEALEKIVDRVKTSDVGLAQQRGQIDGLIAETDKAADAIRPRLDATKAQLDQLGPPPKAGQPAESPEISGERQRLTALVSALEGAMKSTELVRVRARQLSTQVLELRRGLFADNLFHRSTTPLLVGVWADIAADSNRVAQQLDGVFGTWRTILGHRLPALLGVLAATCLVYGLLWLATRRAIARLTPRSPDHPPTYTTRATAATLTAPLYLLPTVAAAGLCYLGFRSFDLTYSRVDGLTLDLLQAVVTFSVVTALASAILTPRKPAWRLLDLADSSAGSLWRSIRMIALIYVTDLVMKEMIRILDLPLPFHVALSFVTTLAFSTVLLRVVATPLVPVATIIADAPVAAAPAVVSRWRPYWLKLPLLAIALAIVVTALTGYVALSRFAAGQVVITGSAVVLALLLHLAIRTTERAAVSTDTLIGNWLANGLGLGETHRSLVGNSLSAVLNIALAILALPALLLAWGFSLTDVVSGMRSALFGFEIGHFRISLVRLFMAIGLFAGLLFATRLIQRGLQATLLRPERMDAGIANSIYQGIGYVGFALAALLSISFGGIDITNLAILAGALSVGIGFGLQSIVNNFVSGLILLVERPIKVGDWIVLKDGGQGYVRSISVRSTEIETFDRSSLIVPNSELISSVVTNWTHRNALGRVVVKLSTDYNSDPEHVLRVLHECADASPMVLKQPAPLITLDNFGTDGLEFSVRVVVPDINRALGVQTDLRTRIYKAFKREGIQFPTPERAIMIRDLGGLEGALERMTDQDQARSRAAGNQA